MSRIETGFSIGGDVLNGLSKLIEECGEVIQVAGKLLATGGKPEHWEGSNLHSRIEEEIADLLGSIWFFIDTNNLHTEFINDRMGKKFRQFFQWNEEQKQKPEIVQVEQNQPLSKPQGDFTEDYLQSLRIDAETLLPKLIKSGNPHDRDDSSLVQIIHQFIAQNQPAMPVDFASAIKIDAAENWFRQYQGHRPIDHLDVRKLALAAFTAGVKWREMQGELSDLVFKAGADEEKYGKVATSGKQLLPGEPVFILRGIDPNTCVTLLDYYCHCRDQGCEDAHLIGINEAMKRIGRWQVANSTLVKVKPD